MLELRERVLAVDVFLSFSQSFVERSSVTSPHSHVHAHVVTYQFPTSNLYDNCLSTPPIYSKLPLFLTFPVFLCVVFLFRVFFSSWGGAFVFSLCRTLIFAIDHYRPLHWLLCSLHSPFSFQLLGFPFSGNLAYLLFFRVPFMCFKSFLGRDLIASWASLFFAWSFGLPRDGCSLFLFSGWLAGGLLCCVVFF